MHIGSTRLASELQQLTRCDIFRRFRLKGMLHKVQRRRAD